MSYLKSCVWFMVLVPVFYSTGSFGDGEGICPLQRDTFQTETLADDANVFRVAEYLKKEYASYVNKLKANSSEETYSADMKFCEKLTGALAEATVSISSTDEEIAKRKREVSMSLANVSRGCLAVIKASLGEESVRNGQCPKMTDVINKETASLEKISAINDRAIELLKKEVDPEKPIKNFTPEQLAAIEAKGDFSSVASESTHYGVMELGVSFMPEYDTDGNNKGFKEANLFGILRLSNRFKEKDNSVSHWVHYQELDVAFYSAPVACTDKEGTSGETGDSTEGNSDPQKNCVGNPSIENIKFRDISNTVNASVVWSALYKDPDMLGSWEAGLFGRTGILNREKKGTDGDSVAKFYSCGVELRLNDSWATEAGSKYHNGLPRFILNWGTGKNEDFAGTGKTTRRELASFNYRIFENQPVFLGLIVDGGNGPDTIALNLSYGLKSSSVFGLFAN